MGRRLAGPVGATALLALIAIAALLPGAGSAAGNKKLVEGTVYDTTCAGTTCECPPPPHCGPITAQRDALIVCPVARRRIVACPLAKAAVATPYPLYPVEGAVVKVRRRGSSTSLATLPVVEGHFQVRLAPGEYVLHPYLPEETCWSGEPSRVAVTARSHSPVAASIDVADHCVAHPDNG